MSHDPIVIVSAVRTPLGRFMGSLSTVTATALGAHVIKAAVERAQLPPDRVNEVLMGCVLPAGQGQAPARQAARQAGLPDHVGASTINKVCGSGMKATMLAHDMLLAGSAEIVVAGGMESMSNAPYLLPGARAGYRVGHNAVVDHMMFDGLEDAYERGRAMGDFGKPRQKPISSHGPTRMPLPQKHWCARAGRSITVPLPRKLPPSPSRPRQASRSSIPMNIHSRSRQRKSPT